MFLILGLFVYFLYTFVFDSSVGSYEKSKMLCVFFYQYNIWNYIIIQYHGDKIYVISEINIFGKYLRLKKRYLKSLSISIQQLISLRLGFRRNSPSVSSSQSRFKAHQRHSGHGRTVILFIFIYIQAGC